MLVQHWSATSSQQDRPTRRLTLARTFFGGHAPVWYVVGCALTAAAVIGADVSRGAIGPMSSGAFAGKVAFASATSTTLLADRPWLGAQAGSWRQDGAAFHSPARSVVASPAVMPAPGAFVAGAARADAARPVPAFAGAATLDATSPGALAFGAPRLAGPRPVDSPAWEPGFDPGDASRASCSPPAAPAPVLLTREQHNVVRFIAGHYRVAADAAQHFVAEAYQSARDARLDPHLVLAVMSIESSFNPMAQSNRGAKGLMQVLARVHEDKFQPFGGVKAAFDPIANIRVGTNILGEYLARAGSVPGALKWYVGASQLGDDGGYGAKVLFERARIAAAATGRPLPAAEPVRAAPSRDATPPQPAAVPADAFEPAGGRLPDRRDAPLELQDDQATTGDGAAATAGSTLRAAAVVAMEQRLAATNGARRDGLADAMQPQAPDARDLADPRDLGI